MCRGSRDRPGGPRIPMLRLRIGCMGRGRATVFREFDITSPKLFTPNANPVHSSMDWVYIGG